MTKKELIDGIKEHMTAALTSREVGDVLDSLAHVAGSALKENDTVEIPGIVRLKMADRAARTGRNPSTGEALAIPAKRVVKAVALKALA